MALRGSLLRAIAAAETKVKMAWILGVVQAAVTLIAVILIAVAEHRFSFMYIDVVLTAGLSYGIYRKSKVAAISMVALACADALIQVANQAWGAVLFRLLIVAAYVVGTRAVFTLETLNAQLANEDGRGTESSTGHEKARPVGIGRWRSR